MHCPKSVLPAPSLMLLALVHSISREWNIMRSTLRTIAGASIVAKTILLAVIVGALSQSALADTVRHSSIPGQFLGRWAANAGDCDAADKSAIVLSSKRYAGAGQVCAVDWVDELPSAKAPIYSAHLKCSGPGDQPSNIVLWEKEANQISAGATLDTLKTLQRCPEK